MARSHWLAALAAAALTGCAAKQSTPPQTTPVARPAQAAPRPAPQAAPAPQASPAQRPPPVETIRQSSAPAASPTQVTFQIKSNYPHKVQIAYYSQTRRGHAWPGGSQAYALNDYNVHTHTLNCTPGEKICYGAWVTGGGSKYWGVGANNRHGCSNCCSTCGAGTLSHTLQP